jgi:hypothetical protein
MKVDIDIFLYGPASIETEYINGFKLLSLLFNGSGCM